MLSEVMPDNGNVKLLVRQAYKDILDRQPDSNGLIYYSSALLNREMTYEQLRRILLDSEEYKRMSIFLTPTTLNFFNGRIAFIQEVHSGDFRQAIQNVIRFDKCNSSIMCIVVYDQTLNSDDVERLASTGATLIFSKWEDNLPQQRNVALDLARELRAEWVISCDPDEHFTEETITDIRYAIGDAISADYDMIQINCRNRDEREEHKTTYFKDLVFKMTPHTEFIGHGNMPITHEGVIGLKNAIRLDKRYYYVHTRTQKEITEHHVRELFVSGGGPSLGAENPAWVELRQITDRLQIKYWNEMKSYCKKGYISEELKQFILRHKDDNGKDGDQNLREFYKYYFMDLHPNEML